MISPENIRWSLYDVCPGGRIIKASPPFDTPGEYTEDIINRKSRYMYVIIDTAGDGICCNHGPHGFFQVSVDNVVQFRGGDDGPFTTKTEYFGECSSPTTLKPTNAVRHLLRCHTIFSIYSMLLIFHFIIR